jgi:streptogramin lyase
MPPRATTRASDRRRGRRGAGLLALVAVAAPALTTGCGADAPDHRASRAAQSSPARLTRTGAGPVGLAADGDGRVWVAQADEGTVARLAPSAADVTHRTRVGSAPLRMAAAGGSLWVTVFRDGSLVRVDPGSGAIVATVRVGPTPEGVATAAGSIWVVLEEPAELVRVDPTHGKVVSRRHLGDGPRLVARGLGRLWVSDYPTGRVLRVDPATGRVRASRHVCDGPQGMAASHGRLWVACTTAEEVVSLSPRTLEVVTRTALDKEPDAVAVDRRGRVLVASQDGPVLSLLDPSDGRVSTRMTLGRSGPLGDQANVDLVVVGEHAVVSSYREGGVHRVALP